MRGSRASSSSWDNCRMGMDVAGVTVSPSGSGPKGTTRHLLLSSLLPWILFYTHLSIIIIFPRITATDKYYRDTRLRSMSLRTWWLEGFSLQGVEWKFCFLTGKQIILGHGSFLSTWQTHNKSPVCVHVVSHILKHLGT